MSDLLWKPTERKRLDSNMTAFMEYVEKRWGESTPTYERLYEWSTAQSERFWTTLWDFVDIIAENRGETVILNPGNMKQARFFPEARLNFAENLLRRRDDGLAVISWSENKPRREVSHRDLYGQVSKLAQAMEALGLGVGSRIAGILPNVPETLSLMLAANSIGAVWSQCSPDFGARGILDRLGQIDPELLILCDGYSYKGATLNSSELIPLLRHEMRRLKRIVVLPFADPPIALPADEVRVTMFSDFVSPFSVKEIHFRRLPFVQQAFILYTSGTTGKPKCIVHSAGGVLMQLLKEHYLHFDLKPGDRFAYYTTTGWNMWYTLIAALGAGGIVCMYEGSPFYPHISSLLDFIEQERVNIFGTSPKYIRTLEDRTAQPCQDRELSCLNTILTTGAPLLPDQFDYLYREFGKSIRVSSISGGTEIMTTFANGNPIGPVYRGELQCRTLGMSVAVFNESGEEIRSQKGELVCTTPFPSQPVCFVNDPDNIKYHGTYYSRYPNVWTHGDIAEITHNDGLVIHGRSDAVLNPGGVRIGTAEIYQVVETMPEVADSIVVGQEILGDVRVILFVQMSQGVSLNDVMKAKIKAKVRRDATPRHVPTKVIEVSDIPHTINGKKTELVVRNIVNGRPETNIGSVSNPDSLSQFRNLSELQC